MSTSARRRAWYKETHYREELDFGPINFNPDTGRDWAISFILGQEALVYVDQEAGCVL